MARVVVAILGVNFVKAEADSLFRGFLDRKQLILNEL